MIRESTTYAVNQAKWKAAREWCADRRIEFKIITEDELGIRTMEDDFQFVEQVGNNRLEFAKDSIRDLGDPEDMMVEIMSILNETVIIPDVGETYTLFTMQKLLVFNMTYTPWLV